jgi:hypothetical protein
MKSFLVATDDFELYLPGTNDLKLESMELIGIK